MDEQRKCECGENCSCTNVSETPEFVANLEELRGVASRPLFFDSNRVYRVYKGGKGLGEFFETGDEADDFFPEEWIASCVKAVNPQYFGERDGVSNIEGPLDIWFDDLLKQFPDELLGGKKFDILVKILDSAVRLPMQVHPDKAFAKQNFGSDYGKTEAWLVLATRGDAKLFFGFKDYVSRAQLLQYEEKSELEKGVMEGILNSVSVKPGDVWLINAGLVHAIGAGCTILEIMEPTDFTIQPESWCGDYYIDKSERYMGLRQSKAYDCFEFGLYGEKAIESATVKPHIVYLAKGIKTRELISYGDTPCFSLRRHEFSGGKLELTRAPAVFVVLEGIAWMVGPDGYKRCITQGDYFFFPAAAKDHYAIFSDDAVIAECLPSKQ